jgi:hypothetical protein
MTGLSFREITVAEIQISHQRRIEKCRSIRRGFAANERALITASEILDLLFEQSD